MGSLLVNNEKAARIVEGSGIICSLSAMVLGFFGTGYGGPLVVASSALSSCVWFMCFVSLMLRYM